MTWKVIDDVTGRVHFCSLVRPVNNLSNPNKGADTISGDDIEVDYPTSITPMSLPDSTWETPINEALFSKISLKDGEMSNEIFAPLDDLSANGSFESTTREHNPTVHPWVDNIVIPLKNKDGTAKLDDTGNPL